MDTRLEAHVTANIRQFESRMARVNAIARATANRVIVEVDARTNRFEGAMNRLARMMNSLSTVIGGALHGAMQSAFPAMVPAVSSLIGVVGSLGPVIGANVGQLGALSSAFGTAGIGAIGYGALAVTSISGVIESSQDLEKLQAKLDDATSAKERAKIMEQIKNLQSSLGKEEKEALKTLQEFKDNWRDIGTMVQKPILKTFSMSLNTFKLTLNSLIPMFDGLAKEGVGLAKSMDKAFKAPDMQRFISYLNKEAPGAFASFGRSAGNVLRTVFNLIVAFGPAGKSMTQSIEGMTQSWVKWSAHLGESEKFKAFMAYAQKNGPKLWQVIGNISSALTSLFTGFAPLSADMMTTLVDLTAKFKTWAASAKNSKEFQDFIGYIRTNGPVVWSTLGEISKTVINLMRGMAPFGQQVLEVVNGFVSWTAATTAAHPAIGKFMGVAISLTGALRALTPVIISFETLFNGFSGIKKAVDLLKNFKTTAAGIKLINAITQLKNFTRATIAMNAEAAKTKFTAMINGLKNLGATLKLRIAMMAAFIKQQAVMAAQSVAASARMAAAWTVMKIQSFITMLKNGIIQMGLWIKNMALMAAQSVANATRMAVAWTVLKITSFIVMMKNGIIQMGLWIKNMALMAAQSVANATRIAAAWVVMQISSFVSMMSSGISMMLAFGRQLVVTAALATANAVRMAAAWVIAMGPIGWITTAVIGLVALIIANWDTVKTVTIAVWGVISSWLSTVWTGIKTIATSIWSGLKSFFTSMWSGTKTVFTSVWNGIKSVATSVWNAISSSAKSIWNGIKSALTSIWNGIKSVATSVWNGLKSFFTSWLNAQKRLFTTVWNAVKTAVTAVWRAIVSVGKSVWNGLKSFFTSLLQGIKTVFTTTWNAIKSAVTNVWNGLKSTASRVFNAMKSSITSIMNNVKSKIKAIWNSVMRFFKGINLASIGRNIMQGLINGVTGMWGKVESTFSRLTNAIPKTIKKVLGIHSPSRIMRDQVGYHIGTGLAKGIDGSTRLVSSAASSLAKSAIPKVPDIAGMDGLSATASLSQSIDANLGEYDVPDKEIVLQLNGREVGRGIYKDVKQFINMEDSRR